jgi:hypothetical protein
MRKFSAVLILSALMIVVPATAQAATRGGGKTSGTTAPASLQLVMVYDANADGAPNYGDTVTFNVTQSSTDKPYVSVNCSQDGAWVSSQTNGMFASYTWGQNFTMASSSWTSGAADCTANLHYTSSRGKTVSLTDLAFTVAA